MTQINTTTYIIDAVKSIENGFTEVQKLLDELCEHSIKDKKITYAKTAKSLKYVKGMIDSIALVIDNITDSNNYEVSTIINLFDHWDMEYKNIRKSILQYKEVFLETENTNKREEIFNSERIN